MDKVKEKRFWQKVYLVFFSLLVSTIAIAQEYTINDIPNVHIQDRTRYVSDPNNILSSYARSTIDSILYALDQTTGIETAVVVLPSIGNEDCFDFTVNLFNEWQVGKRGKDNGLIILLVTDQRCIQFVTGYGLEGDLPDAISKRIQTQYMIPYLRNNDWDNGMIAGVRAVYSRLDGSMVNDTPPQTQEEDGSFLIVYIFLGLLLFYFIARWFSNRKARKCPVCKKYKLKQTDVKVISKSRGRVKRQITCTCQNCGNKVVRIVDSSDNDSGFGGPFIGGFGGGFFGGTGFGGGGGGLGGGSFGGGMTGGGGAGSRF